MRVDQPLATVLLSHVSENIELRNAKPRKSLYRLSDGDGLSFQVDPNGSRAWRFRYRFQGRQKMLSLGTYPEVPLMLARKRRDEARNHVAAGIDPSAVRAAEKHAHAQSFEAVAREWHAMNAPTWAPSHAEKVLIRLEKNIFPWLGTQPIASIEAPALLECLRRVERRGAADTARRVRQYVGAIFRYAIATNRAKRDVAADLRDAIKAPVKGHYPTITDPKKDLAEYVGITEANLSLLKQGRVKGVRFETLERICEYLDCQPGDLLLYERPAAPQQ